jgi:glycosyltransferase involved in cell wall biosynthesis
MKRACAACSGKEPIPVKVAMIAAALPPQLDGIGDYSARIAAEMAKTCEVTVLTGDDAAHDPIPGCEMVTSFTPMNPATMGTLAEKVIALKPDWVLLQYNPFSYGKRGWNPNLASAMARIKRESPGTRIAVMAHETFMPLKGSPSWWVMHAYQRWQFVRLGKTVDLLFLSIETWAKTFGQWFPRIPVVHLPVGSNMPRVEITRQEARERLGIKPETLVIGLFGQAHISRMLEQVGNAMRTLHRERPDILLLYIGPHAANVRSVAGNVPLLAEGPFPAEEVSRRFSAMDIYLVPFIDGVSTRRTSFMTGIQHGLPTVSTYAYHTDSMLLAENEKAYLLTATDNAEALPTALRRLGNDESLRTTMAARGEQFYLENFTYEGITARMLDEFRRVAEGRTPAAQTAAEGKVAAR